jgi:hypothetical protein
MIAGIDVTFRYRVGWAVALSDSAVSLSDVREFRTMAGAEGYQKEIAETGREALLQVGVLQWLTPEAAAEMVQDVVSAGARLT